jgi:hypothetical protein
MYIDGKPFLIDAGVGSYTRETFSDKRYTIWTMQSAYHNLPTFGGFMQGHGANYKAANVKYKINEKETCISMEISRAYPEEACVLKYERSICFKKGLGVYISDVYDGKHTADLSLLFYYRPEIFAQTIEIPESGRITVGGANNIQVEEIIINDPILLKVWSNSLYRILISFNGKLDLEITPL